MKVQYFGILSFKKFLKNLLFDLFLRKMTQNLRMIKTLKIVTNFDTIVNGNTLTSYLVNLTPHLNKYASTSLGKTVFVTLKGNIQ